MTLYREHYIGGKYRKDSIEGGVDITISWSSGNSRQIKIEASKIHTVLEDVTYWRKANQIHGWITEGFDDDRRADVSGERLIELREICQKVINFLKKQKRVTKVTKIHNEEHHYEGFEDDSLAFELLPPVEGFFFGTYIVDEWYLADLEGTVEALKDIDPDDHFIYEASY
jgi:hypothetical protein